jgi:hypothetical protein
MAAQKKVGARFPLADILDAFLLAELVATTVLGYGSKERTTAEPPVTQTRYSI